MDPNVKDHLAANRKPSQKKGDQDCEKGTGGYGRRAVRQSQDDSLKEFRVEAQLQMEIPGVVSQCLDGARFGK